MGSGTTAMAAKLCGRNFIGIDLSSEHCKMARDRIKKYNANPSKGDPFKYEKAKRVTPKNKKPLTNPKDEPASML